MNFFLIQFTEHSKYKPKLESSKKLHRQFNKYEKRLNNKISKVLVLWTGRLFIMMTMMIYNGSALISCMSSFFLIDILLSSWAFLFQCSSSSLNACRHGRHIVHKINVIYLHHFPYPVDSSSLNSYNMMKMGKYAKHTATLLIEMLLNWKMCVLFLSHIHAYMAIKIKHYTKLNNLIFILIIVKA